MLTPGKAHLLAVARFLSLAAPVDQPAEVTARPARVLMRVRMLLLEQAMTRQVAQWVVVMALPLRATALLLLAALETPPEPLLLGMPLGPLPGPLLGMPLGPLPEPLLLGMPLGPLPGPLLGMPLGPLPVPLLGIPLGPLPVPLLGMPRELALLTAPLRAQLVADLTAPLMAQLMAPAQRC